LPALLLFAATPATAAAKWDPISPEDLAAKDSATNPGTDVEILDSRVEFSCSETTVRIHHTLRVKIYTQKGVNDRGALDVEWGENEYVTDLVARVVKPDGRILLPAKDDFHETLVMDSGADRLKKTSLAFPDLAPGDVVDFQWTKAYRPGHSYYSYWNYAQDRYPVRHYLYTVLSFPYNYTVSWFNCRGELKADGKQAMALTVHGMPAFEPEDFLPPEREFRGWVTLIRTPESFRNDDEVWKELSLIWSDDFDERTKSGSLKKKAAEITAGATTDEEKLQRIYQFCQDQLGNFDWADTPDQKTAKEKHEEAERTRDQSTRWAPEVVKAGDGTPEEINGVFAGLARAVGFEVREARNASRAEMLNIRITKGWAFLDRSHVAVKMGGQWRFFDPGHGWEPYGLLDWKDEMATMLICSDEKLSFQDAPVAPAKASPVSRKARFTVDVEGTLEGLVEESYSGHAGVELKQNNWEKSQDDTDKRFIAAVVKRLPSAEVSDLHWENLRNHVYPVIARYKVRVPGYAEGAGKRLTLAPGFFEAGQPAVLASASRRYPVFFHYARAEHDDIEIVLPEGFQLDHPSAPAKVGDPASFFGAEYRIGFAPKQHLLRYTRDFSLGDGMIAFQARAYPVLKQLFNGLRTSDSHSLILRPAETPAPLAVSPQPEAARPATAGSPTP